MLINCLSFYHTVMTRISNGTKPGHCSCGLDASFGKNHKRGYKNDTLMRQGCSPLCNVAYVMIHMLVRSVSIVRLLSIKCAK